MEMIAQQYGLSDDARAALQLLKEERIPVIQLVVLLRRQHPAWSLEEAVLHLFRVHSETHK